MNTPRLQHSLRTFVIFLALISMLHACIDLGTIAGRVTRAPIL